MPPITLTLTLDETNLVLEALGQMPYARVYRLVDVLGEQARAQVEQAAARSADEPVTGRGVVRPA